MPYFLRKVTILKKGCLLPDSIVIPLSGKGDNPQITRRYPAYKPPITRILKEAGYRRLMYGSFRAQLYH